MSGIRCQSDWLNEKVQARPLALHPIKRILRTSMKFSTLFDADTSSSHTQGFFEDRPQGDKSEATKVQLERLSKLPFKTHARMEDLKKNWAVEYTLVD
jgi:hypothetical protein